MITKRLSLYVDTSVHQKTLSIKENSNKKDTIIKDMDFEQIKSYFVERKLKLADK